jgi:hypothetical protein
MQKLARFPFIPAALAVAGLCLGSLMTQPAVAQDKVHEEYQAQAMGQSTQLGQTFNVTIIIEQYSTAEERQALVDSFDKAGSQGLFNALNKMRSKGHIAITGTLGYDISFVRKIANPDGTSKIRILTDRPITFGEAWSDSRSMDYNLSALELDLTPVAKKDSGSLIPACQFAIDKKTKELTIEAYQNAWKLVDVLDWNKRKKK